VNAPVCPRCGTSIRERRDVLMRVERAREAIADGDLELAAHVLDDLIADVARRLRGERDVVCPECKTRFRWPGELDEHRERVHDRQDDEPSADVPSTERSRP
jgi:uncharacterized C2H2 Zn-finger protein